MNINYFHFDIVGRNGFFRTFGRAIIVFDVLAKLVYKLPYVYEDYLRTQTTTYFAINSTYTSERLRL